jgi:type I restriction enzyme, S subunit
MIWPATRLAPTLARVIRGVTFSQSDVSREEFDGSVPVLRAGNIQRRLVTESDLVWVDRGLVGAEQYLQRKDIVVCTSSGSTSLVGKSAILQTEFKGAWGAFNAVIRCNPDILLPEYLSFWMSSEAFRVWKERQVQGANIQNLRQSALESIRLPLPTLPEQKRIVDVLQQAEALARAKQSISEQIDQLVRTAYWEHFGAWYTADGLIDPVRISDCIADLQYGVSEAMEDYGTHAVLRMNSITTSGWVDLSELKYANLSGKDIASTELQDGDVLFNRTNSKELVGKCAVWRPVAGAFSFASYLIRLRLKSEMLPEYLWATLNSAYGKYRLTNSAKQAVSMANVSPTDLGRITVPLPPLNVQHKFAKFVRSVEALRSQMLGKLDAFVELQKVVSQQALIGELTSAWYVDNGNEISEALQTRDALLRERGTKIALSATSNATPPLQGEVNVRPARHWLMGELSEFQRQLLAAFTVYCQTSGEPLLAEDPDVFARFCDDTGVNERLQAFGTSHGNRIRRTLSQLAALGLIARVTLPKVDLESGERDYLKAFRPLRGDEFTRMNDLQALRKALSADVDQKNYYFQAHLDRAASEHAGAGGMFQVVSIEDGQGKDFTYLVDQGRHYASLDDLKFDLATALKVAVNQIELKEK